MRIRTIKPEFFTHDRLFEVERETKLPLRVAFAGLWCAADREGRFKWEPRRLGVAILPYDGIDFSRVLHALATRGFIQYYTSEAREFGCIPSFSRHQVVNNRERESELPEPPPMAEGDACPTRQPRVPHATLTCTSGREGKGKEQGKEGNKEGARGSRVDLSAYAVEIGLPESDGASMFDHWESNGWRNGSNPVRDWKAGIRKWKSQGWLPSQKQTNGTAKPAHAPFSRNTGTTNETGWQNREFCDEPDPFLT